MTLPLTVKLTVSQSKNVFPFKVQTNSLAYKMGLATQIEVVGGTPYSGRYTVTPTRETQVLETANLKMAENVTINPIPSNYGLITWNGSTLVVS